MSRTYKDRPSRLKHGSYADDTLRVPYEAEYYGYALADESDWKLIRASELKTGTRYYTLHLPTTKTKKSRSVDTEWHWLGSTPSWWNNLFHTRPIRGKFRKFSNIIVKSQIEEIEDILEPSDSKAPHKYFY